MNIDCHYYGTYYVARMAGFQNKEALKIAWAAQTVDECMIKNLKETKKKLPDDQKELFEKNLILTVTDAFDDLRDASSIGDPLDEEVDEDLRLTALRAIWMPFHFLPGNFYPAIDKTQVERFRGEKYYHYILFFRQEPKWTSQDEHDMSLMCRTSTNTCRTIIEHAKKQYDAFKESDPDRALFAVGIMLHVLADTWSHEYFCGSPNIYVNYIGNLSWDVKKIEDDGSYQLLTLSSLMSSSCHTIDCLGHGIAGHYPDYPFMEKLEFEHAWLNAAPIGQRTRKRNNPERFLEAFCQMLQAMLYIRGHPSFSDASLWSFQTFKSWAKTHRYSLSGEYGALSNAFSRQAELRDYAADLEEIQNDIFKMHKSLKLGVLTYQYVNIQTEQWKQFLKDRAYYVGDYQFELYGTEAIIKFMDMAKRHRGCVISYLTQYEQDDRLAHYKNSFCVIKNGYQPLVFSGKNVDGAVRAFYYTFQPII